MIKKYLNIVASFNYCFAWFAIVVCLSLIGHCHQYVFSTMLENINKNKTKNQCFMCQSCQLLNFRFNLYFSAPTRSRIKTHLKNWRVGSPYCHFATIIIVQRSGGDGKRALLPIEKRVSAIARGVGKNFQFDNYELLRDHHYLCFEKNKQKKNKKTNKQTNKQTNKTYFNLGKRILRFWKR